MMISGSMKVKSNSVAFVLGGANTLVEDYENARKIAAPHTIIATNEAGRDFEGTLPHWVTLHTEKMEAWYLERIRSGKGIVENFWTSNIKNVPPHLGFKRVASWDGSSGLLAVTVALHLGYQKIILCGVPLDKKAAHYFDPNPWMDGPRYRHAWIKYLPNMKDRVKSMSGWTEGLLGAPDYHWIRK